MLTDRWTPLDAHPEQLRLIRSPARFRVVAAGRRSGKTERGKRHLVRCALEGITGVARPTFVAAAPTRDQAKRIFWQDLKALSPREWIESVSESELTIRYKIGSQLMVVGLDRPQRIEGVPLDGIVVDEIAEVKRESWEQSIRPALSTRGRPPGWAWFTGRPKGRGLFYELYSRAGTREGWESFTWTSATVVDPAEIEQARQDLDPLTFAQEYEAQWVSFDGLAYYPWSPKDHLRRLTYDPARALIIGLDFNVDPGTAVVMQEQFIDGETRTCVIGEVHTRALIIGLDFNVDPGTAVVMQEQFIDGETRTCVIGEVHIPKNSNTPAVCRRLVADWGKHAGDVLIYGDPAGGARHTSQTEGTDWDLAKQVLRPAFGDRLRWRVGKKAPYVRDRLNAVNSRLKSTAGVVRLLVDPVAAPNVVRDFEGVTLLAGGSGELDKKGSEAKGLTHLTDALGYYIAEAFGIAERTTSIDY